MNIIWNGQETANKQPVKLKITPIGTDKCEFLLGITELHHIKKYKIKSLPGGRMAELTLKMLVEFPGNQSVIIEHGYENLPRGDAGKTD